MLSNAFAVSRSRSATSCGMAAGNPASGTILSSPYVAATTKGSQLGVPPSAAVRGTDATAAARSRLSATSTTRLSNRSSTGPTSSPPTRTGAV